MQFDETRYAQDFIKKLRGARVLPDDLLARYAITLPATDSEIANQVKAVRAYWNKASSGSTHAAHVAQLCRAEDERLKARHGSKMEQSTWWEAQQAQRQSAAQAAVTSLADELRQRYGQLGVVTADTVDGFAAKLSLTRTDALQAVGHAGLKLVDGGTLPGAKPFPAFDALLKNMSEYGVASVPDLVHPGSGPFSLIDRYACTGDPAKRLDVVAVNVQIREADKRAISTTENAHKEALKILLRACKDGVDLRDIALYHLITVAREYVPLSMKMAAEELQKAGLVRHDAAVIAVVLADQNSARSLAGLAKVRDLLTSGRLNEARQTALSLPTDSPNRQQAVKDVEDARKRLDGLLAEAQRALEIPDEVRAAALLREAAVISSEDAEEALAAVPCAPPAGLRAVCEAATVKLFWQPATGHDDDTSYVVTRTGQRPPAAPGDGLVVYQGPATSCNDTHVPVARPVQYGVFALGTARPSSRPATVPVVSLPPVSHLDSEVGPAEVTIHWSAHPDVHEVKVIRSADGVTPERLTVRGSSCQLTGLPEGQTQYFEVSAVYRATDGAELSSPAERISATPRSQAKPIPNLRVRPVDVAGVVRARVTWKPVDNSEVRIMRSDVLPPWQFGTWVSPEDLAQFGEEVTGRRIADRAEIGIEADLPPGVHHIVPFSIGGTGIVMGRPAAVGITDPVRHLAVTPFSTYATVSWEWPPAAQLAEVSWEAGNDADCVTIGQAQYRSQGGACVPLGHGPCTIEVRAVIMADGVPYTSPPVRETVDSGADVTVRYTVSGSSGVGPFGGRSRNVAFSCDEGCAGVQVRMVAQLGRVMPTKAEGGFVLLDTTLALRPGVPVEHHVTIPRSVKRPYWVRCFVVGGRARLIDPPISSLKEA
jgi:hypothetical protein